MGQFSWLDCENKSQILDDVYEDVYVLVPKEFGGKNIHETCYDGYGNFGGKDVYDLVADWNREYLSKNPDFVLPFRKTRVSDFPWYPAYADLSLSREDVVKAWKTIGNELYTEWRCIGIYLACYDEDNEALPYPIKITHNGNLVYEHEKPSIDDPNQGWQE